MASFRDQFDKDVDVLRRMRDELEVQLHLGGAEARDQWAKLERVWQHIEGRAKVVADESNEVAEDLGDTLQLLADQLSDGYERIKKLF